MDPLVDSIPAFFYPSSRNKPPGSHSNRGKKTPKEHTMATSTVTMKHRTLLWNTTLDAIYIKSCVYLVYVYTTFERDQGYYFYIKLPEALALDGEPSPSLLFQTMWESPTSPTSRDTPVWPRFLVPWQRLQQCTRLPFWMDCDSKRNHEGQLPSNHWSWTCSWMLW